MSPKKRVDPVVRRVTYYAERVAAEPTFRKQLHRVGDWVVSEALKRPERERQAVLERFMAFARELNERNAHDDGQ